MGGAKPSPPGWLDPRRWGCELGALLCTLLMVQQFLSVAAFSLNAPVAPLLRRLGFSASRAQLLSPTVDGVADAQAVNCRHEEVLRPLLQNLALFVVFCAQHSLMGRLRFQKRVTNALGHATERALHLLLSSAAMQLLMLAWQPMPCTHVWRLDSALEPRGFDLFRSLPRLAECASGALLQLLSLSSVLYLLLSLCQIIWFDLFCYRQAFVPDLEFPTAPKLRPLPFVYSITRSPLFTALLAVMWFDARMVSAHAHAGSGVLLPQTAWLTALAMLCALQTIGHLLFTAVFTAYTELGVLLQERDLLLKEELEGKERPWHRYMKRVPRLVPGMAPASDEDLARIKTRGLGLLTGGQWDEKPHHLVK